MKNSPNLTIYRVFLLFLCCAAVFLFCKKISFTISSDDPPGQVQTSAPDQPDDTSELPSLPDSTPIPFEPLKDPDSSLLSTDNNLPIPGESMQESSPPTKDQWFSHTLFIGDSRTVGLRDYAELSTADFFCSSGLSSFSLFKKTLEVEGIGETTLEALLTDHQYTKIYFMLGINELGYPFSSIVSQYTHVVNKIHELHPQAKIYLCANLRVVADGREVRDYVANDTINQLNEEIAKLADEKDYYYIDANPLFDDGNGALDSRYCPDDLHLYGKYYYQWAEWLWTQGCTSECSYSVTELPLSPGTVLY